MLLAATIGGCGDGDEDARLTVSAAASLKPAFEEYASSFEEADVRFSFAGSDELAAQIRRGARPDVYAAANTALPDALFESGDVEMPVTFARNELVIAAPADAGDIDSAGDLAAPGVQLVIGDPDVPIGAYARTALDRLPDAERQAILANVRSEEPDAFGIVAKLTQGAADAGLLYASDVTVTDGELRTVRLPAKLAPDVRYGIAVVSGSGAEREAQLFIEGLLEGAGAEAMKDAGFLPPPEGGAR